MRTSRPQHGAALLTAMLTVTLVATFSATALWQQWRSAEVEAAERARSQQTWVLTGALDWARLILREDALTSPIDHLSEPWALPLQEARLSSFLAFDKNNTDDSPDVFLSGQISDLQARMNVLNLVNDGRLSESALLAFGRLFALLNLPQSQLAALADNLRLAINAESPQAWASLPPQRIEQLTWLGLPEQTLGILKPHITLLPVRTALNLNTASAEVIHASVPQLDMTQARRLVQARANRHFSTLEDALKEAGVPLEQANNGQLGVASRFFEIRGRLRLAQSTVQEHSIVERQDQDVKVLWREREVVYADTGSPSNSNASYSQ